jgi:hypothetical protein
MAWTYPPTKTLGSSSITTGDWNTYVRDNLEALMERPTCTLSDAQTTASSREVPSGVETIVRWFSEEWDSHNLHSNVANQSRVTIPSGFGGAYLVCTTISFRGGDPDGYRRVRILLNGSAEWAQAEEIPAAGNARTSVCCVALVNASPGDYIQVEAYQDSGTALELLSADEDDELGCELSVLYMGQTDGGAGFAFSFSGLAGKTDLIDWWNKEVRDSFIRLRYRPMAAVSMSSATSTSASSWSTCTFTTELFDTDSMWGAGQPTRLTATRSGYYLAFGQANFAASGTEQAKREVRWALNGTGTGWRSSSKPTTYATYSMACLGWFYLDAGEYLQLQTWQASGGSLNRSARAFLLWMGERDRPANQQRLSNPVGWSDDAYSVGAAAGPMSWGWITTHTRDLPGIAYNPPLVATRARFARDITPGEWKKVKFNRQQNDPWNLVKGKRHFGEKFVIPQDGVYVTGAQINIKDDPVVNAKISVPTKTFTVDTATNVVTSTAHGLRTRTPITLGNTGGALPGGLTDNGDPYYIRRVAPILNSFTLHPTRRDAANNTNVINITSTGTGTHRWSTSVIDCRELNLRTGTRVRFSSTGTLPLGLVGGATDMYVIRAGKDRFRVALSEELAHEGTHVILFDSGSGTHTVTVQEPYGSRGVRLVQAGEVQGGWHGSAGMNFDSCRPCVSIVAAKAEDEMWVEAITRGPEGSRISASDPISRWFVAWAAPYAYTGAVPMADRT